MNQLLRYRIFGFSIKLILFAFIISFATNAFMDVFYYNTTRQHATNIIIKEKIEEKVEYRHPAQELVWGEVRIKGQINNAERLCLAKNIFFESRGESIVGQISVGQVTINRVVDGSWGNSICKVVYSNKQFSWTDNLSAKQSVPGRNSVLRGQHWEASLMAADLVLRGLYLPVLESALFYHNIFVTPTWHSTDKFIIRIESHLFYTK